MRTVSALLRVVSLLFSLVWDAIRFILLWTRSCVSLSAENLFLRKQLALYLERKAKPRGANDSTRLALALLSKLFVWKEALVIVKPETLIGWHRRGFRLFWGWKSERRGRPRIPINLRNLIVEMARGNPSWGEERIAAELLLKLGIRVSPRTVRRYRTEAFCYGPRSCALYRSGPARKVPGRRGMTYTEEGWMDDEATSHRGLDD
jgi:hypothetical protein